MIEQIPLAFIIDNTVVVGPAAVLMLRHDQALILIRTHRVLTHGVAEHLSIIPYVWVGEVVPTVSFESERAFSLAVGQAFETVHTNHLHLAVAELDG